MQGETSAASNRGPSGATMAPYRFGVVHSPERLSEVLELRRITHLAAGQVEPHRTAAEMVEPRDLEATMVIAEQADQLVGTTRLVPPLEGTILHCGCRLEGAVDELPPKDEMIEASSGCIHPEHQGQGLFWNLVAHAWNTAAQVYGRPLLVGACEDRLWPFWQRCGFCRVPVYYAGAVTGRRYQVMLLELAPVLEGQGVDRRLARHLRALRSADRHGLSASPPRGRH